ncbi:hypothetical protein BD821_1221, partial [Clostridium algidicarnis DSM 15099]
KNILLSNRLYKGIELVGKAEEIKTDVQCEKIMNAVNRMGDGVNDYKRLILTPQRDKEYLLYNLYEDQVIFGIHDTDEVLQYGR